MLGNSTVHIEQLSRFTQTVLEKQGVHAQSNLYNELCNARETEEDAHEYFATGGNDDLRRTPFYDLSTRADPGLDYHVDAWTSRHRNCAREPNARARRFRLELETWLRRPKLSLELLRTCKQVYREARLVPYQRNVFAFGSAGTFQSFALSRGRDQLAAINHLNVLVCVGTAPFSDARARDWVQALAWRNTSRLIGSLRSLDVSVECYNVTAPDGGTPAKPAFERFLVEVEGSDQRLTCWMKELGVLCEACSVTVMLADDPLSPWGPIGKALYCQDTRTGDEEWRRKRARTCLTVDEKREFAGRISGLLREEANEWHMILNGVQQAE